MYISEAKAIVSKSPFELLNSLVIAKLYNETDTPDESAIIVNNVPPDVDEDFLELFFEKKEFGGFTVVSVELNSNDASAIVTFDSPVGKR